MENFQELLSFATLVFALYYLIRKSVPKKDKNIKNCGKNCGC